MINPQDADHAYELGRRAGRQEVFDALPDQIEIYRVIKASGALKHAAIAKVVADRYAPIKEGYGG